MSRRLTQKMENFCVEYVSCGVAGDAYRKAYNSKSKNNVVWVRSSELMNDPRVVKRIEQLREKVASKAGLSLVDHLKDLKTLRNAATMAKQFGPAVSAEVSRGKASGLYVDEVKHSGSISYVVETVKF